jgi:BirA family biotin operon repressor/biotin-[acetyl-CoA-carboxylase] ligase
VGQNLTFSLVLEPTFVAPANQFLLSEAVALGVVDMLDGYGIGAKIKWTNDIYVGDRKLAGILIEHKLQGASLARTIVGIGLNVNQRDFPSDLPNPVSMVQLRHFEFDRDEVLDRLVKTIMARYEQLRSGDDGLLQQDYHNRLYRLGMLDWYALPSGRRFRGTIMGVRPTGALVIENEKRERSEYLFKEVEFTIGAKPLVGL